MTLWRLFGWISFEYDHRWVCHLCSPSPLVMVLQNHSSRMIIRACSCKCMKSTPNTVHTLALRLPGRSRSDSTNLKSPCHIENPPPAVVCVYIQFRRSNSLPSVSFAPFTPSSRPGRPGCPRLRVFVAPLLGPKSECYQGVSFCTKQFIISSLRFIRQIPTS